MESNTLRVIQSHGYIMQGTDTTLAIHPVIRSAENAVVAGRIYAALKPRAQEYLIGTEKERELAWYGLEMEFLNVVGRYLGTEKGKVY